MKNKILALILASLSLSSARLFIENGPIKGLLYLLLAIVFGYKSYNFWIKKQIKDSIQTKIQNFKVYGISEYQDIIRKKIDNEKSKNPDKAWGGYNNSDIKNGYRNIVYEIEGLNIPGKITFKEEPNNEYDSNAIAVLLDKNKIGYIHKSKTTNIKNILNKHSYNINWKIKGGKVKEFDWDNNKIITKELLYGIRLAISYY